MAGHSRPKDGVFSHAYVPVHVLIDANATTSIHSRNPFREMVPRLAIFFNGAL